jgi:hypothetical protein
VAVIPAGNVTGTGMTDWTELGVLVGGAAAALVGLLFVAVSIRIDQVARSPVLRARAAQTLTLFLAGLLTSILLVIPHQPLRVLGAEILALVVALVGALLVFGRRAQAAREASDLARSLDWVTPNVGTSLLLGVSGLALVLGQQWGLYVLVPAFIALFTGGVFSAWLFLVKLSP